MNRYSERKKGKLGEKRGIRFFEEDIELIEQTFPTVGYSIIVRKLVHNFANKIRNNELKKGIDTDVNVTIN